MQASRGARHGFSLIEILVIVVIVGIMGRIAMPRFVGESFKVASQARQLSLVLAGAQRLAVTLQSDVRVTFNDAQRRLEVHEDRNNNGVRDAGERIRGTPLGDNMAFGKGGAPDLPLQAGGRAATAISFTSNVLVFHRDGSAGQAGAVFVRSLRDPATTTRVRAVEIVRVGGRPFAWQLGAGGAWSRAE